MTGWRYIPWLLCTSAATADVDLLQAHASGLEKVEKDCGNDDNKTILDGDNGDSVDVATARVLKEGEIVTVHDGSYFQGAFYEHECWQIPKYVGGNCCVKWVDGYMTMVKKTEYDVDRNWAWVAKWQVSEVEKLLDWEVGMMTWDNQSANHPTRMLDINNIRVLDQAGYYYLKKTLGTGDPSYFSFSQPFATFNTGEVGFNNPPYSMCPLGDNVYAPKSGLVPMCCKHIEATTSWSCTEELDTETYYYANECSFTVNDCTDMMQDCTPIKQHCTNMIPAREEDQCEGMSAYCFHADSGKWMWPGSLFVGAAATYPKVQIPASSTKSTDYYFGKYLETGDYKCIWRLSTTATLSEVAMSGGDVTAVLAIWRSGNNLAYYWHEVLFNEWTEPVTYIEDNFIIDEGSVNRLYFRIENKQTAFPLYIELMRMDKIKNIPTEAPTQDTWLTVDGACEAISVTDNGTLGCKGALNEIYKRQGHNNGWVAKAYNMKSDVSYSTDYKYLFMIGTDGYIKYLLNDNMYTLSNSGTSFDRIEVTYGAAKLFALDTTAHKLYERDTLYGSWSPVNGNFIDFGVSGNGDHVWGLQNRSRNNVMYRSTNGVWSRIMGPCKFESIAVTSFGRGVYGVCPSDGTLWYRSGTSGSWEEVFIGVEATKVTVSGTGQFLWVLAKDLSVHYYKFAISPDRRDNFNVALGKPTTQSCVSSGGSPGKAVDGRVDGAFPNGSVTHTCDTHGAGGAFWQVSLGTTRTIERIVVWNRTDCCGERILGAIVEIRKSGVVQASRSITATQNSYVFDFPDGVDGDQVYIHGVDDILSLAEVQVLGMSCLKTSADPYSLTHC